MPTAAVSEMRNKGPECKKKKFWLFSVGNIFIKEGFMDVILVSKNHPLEITAPQNTCKTKFVC